MTKNEIIETIYPKIKKFVENTMKSNNQNSKDLTQDIALSLLEMDDNKIIQLYEKKELDYFVARMITNNYNSVTSPYHKKYRKFSELTEEINYKIKDEYDGN